MKALPENLESLGTVMSNFDSLIEPGTEEKLKAGGCYGEYTAWDFWAAVWYEDGQFQCMVKRYRSHVATLSADTLEEIMAEACQNFGSA